MGDAGGDSVWSSVGEGLGREIGGGPQSFGFEGNDDSAHVVSLGVARFIQSGSDTNTVPNVQRIRTHNMIPGRVHASATCSAPDNPKDSHMRASSSNTLEAYTARTSGSCVVFTIIRSWRQWLKLSSKARNDHSRIA